MIKMQQQDRQYARRLKRNIKHLIAEKLPASLNAQVEMETLFHRRLPHKVKVLSKWKSIDIQRIN